ncbi:MAG: hypothetical protein IH988_03680 [Planctomycetes bacterium]|nr:hypothetical protein [Planctomycetota bacterium]
MRKVTVKMVAYGPLEMGKLYRLIVFHIEKKSRKKCLQVRLRNLDPNQDGRVHELELPLPVLPDGRTAAFLRACGADLEVGGELVIEELSARPC